MSNVPNIFVRHRTCLSAAITCALTCIPVASLSADAILDAMTNDQLVVARQEAMKRNGMVLRGAETLSGVAAEEVATALLETFGKMPDYFRPGSVSAASKALPAVWQNTSQFEEFTAEALLIARVMGDAARSGDQLTYSDAVRAMGNACNECHDVFRSDK